MSSYTWITSPRIHALIAAWTSVFAGLILASLSFLSAHEENSMSLYAICLLSLVDTATSVMVILFWQVQEDMRSISNSIKEHRYTYVIGVLMIFMGIMLFADR